LQLKRADALAIPERTRQLRHAIENGLPRVRIEELLQEVDRHSDFTRELRPIGGYEPRVSNLYQSQLAALIRTAPTWESPRWATAPRASPPTCCST
jgi:hypothetical protein